MEDIEVWKPVIVNEKYEVSSFGRVRNKKTNRILRAAKNGGYMSVSLSNKKVKSFSVHRLVADAFIENPENKPQVNHKDKNSRNNNLSNLEWVTNAENSVHRSFGVSQTTNQNLKLYRMDKDTGEKLEKYDSIYLASQWVFNAGFCKKHLTAKANISRSIKTDYKTAFGFKWSLIEHPSLENEIWREISIPNEDTKGYYISSLGRFRNRKGVVMENYKPHHSGYIYLRVNIKKYAVHRLVASAFIDNPINKPIVNHIDGNKTNNASENLEWVTSSENNLHNHKAGLIKAYTRKVVQFDLQMNQLHIFNSIKETSEQLGISLSSIKAVLKGKQKSTKGFILNYLDN
jgi:hypothetical protein